MTNFIIEFKEVIGVVTILIASLGRLIVWIHNKEKKVKLDREEILKSEQDIEDILFAKLDVLKLKVIENVGDKIGFAEATLEIASLKKLIVKVTNEKLKIESDANKRLEIINALKESCSECYITVINSLNDDNHV